MEMVLSGRNINAERSTEGGPNKSYSTRRIVFTGGSQPGQRDRKIISARVANGQGSSTIRAFITPALMKACYSSEKTSTPFFSTEDQKEGMNAFIEKRKADFKGK